MLCIDEQWKVFETFCAERYGVCISCASRRACEKAVVSSTYPVHGSASKVNRSGIDVQVISCHHYFVVFHPFVEHAVT